MENTTQIMAIRMLWEQEVARSNRVTPTDETSLKGGVFVFSGPGEVLSQVGSTPFCSSSLCHGLWQHEGEP